MTAAPPTLFQSLPSIPSLTTPSSSHQRPTLPALSQVTGRRKPTSFPFQIACSRSQDDYHATLKALNSRARFPRKSLGQHYMLNPEINEQLSLAANVKQGDVVLEIGPGTGSLTNVLINAGAVVLAIEKDPHMADLVRERFAGMDQFKVLHEDFTKCHIQSHMISLLESRKSLAANSTLGKDGKCDQSCLSRYLHLGIRKLEGIKALPYSEIASLTAHCQLIISGCRRSIFTQL